MIFEFHQPKGMLARYVERFIYFEQYESSYLIERFLPDGNVEVVFTLKDEPQYIYDNETLAETQKCANAWASGVRTAPISIPSGNDSRMFVVIFKKGMAHPFFPMPMTELRDEVVDAESIWGREIMDIRERLAESTTGQERFFAAEQFLEALLTHASPGSKFVEYGVSKIISNPTGLSLQRLSEEVGYSRRHFINKFKSGVGLSPKRYMRILRFQRSIQEIEAEDFDWADIALECGYYDQSHFINDFRRFSGFSPSEYYEKKNGNLNYVPVAER